MAFIAFRMSYIGSLRILRTSLTPLDTEFRTLIIKEQEKAFTFKSRLFAREFPTYSRNIDF